jgi:hypothetical protein
VQTIYVYCDNQSIIGRAQSNIYNCKSRHIRHIYNTVKYLITNEIISIDYIKSKENIADLLNKSLSRELVYDSLRKMNLKPLKMKDYNDDNHV